MFDGKLNKFCKETNETMPKTIPAMVRQRKKGNNMSKKEKTIECIKALSKIEGYTMSYEGMKRTGILYDNIDYLMKYFEDLLNDLNK